MRSHSGLLFVSGISGCRCIHDCNFCREQRQTLKEEKPRRWVKEL